MKKIFSIFALIFVVAFSSLSTSAQHRFFIGGALNYNVNSETPNDDDKYTTYGFMPYIGHILSSKMIIGLGLGYSGANDFEDDDNYNKSSLVKITPFFRYRKQVNENLGVYGELNVPVGFGNSKGKVASTEYDGNKTTHFGVNLGPGLDYAFSDRWVINTMWGVLGYHTESIKDVDNSGFSNFGLNLNPAALTFSLNYCF